MDRNSLRTASRHVVVNALLAALSRDADSLIPEGSTILVKASHDCGFSEILAFLQAMG